MAGELAMTVAEEFFAERAAIRQHEGGQSQAKAEKLALEDLKATPLLSDAEKRAFIADREKQHA